jgi:putative transposase
MSNHWHFAVRPREDGQLSDFFRWLTHTHAMRWRVSHRTVGYGHLYQGRFKSFAVEQDEHLLTLCRYVERNALTAGAVKRAQDWRWGSLWVRARGNDRQRALLSDWPIERPRDWTKHVNAPLTRKELAAIELSLKRGRPLGTDKWVQQSVRRLKLEHTIRDEGRPRKRQK